MFNLPISDIHLAAAASDKKNAIEQVAKALENAGYAKSGYAQGMLNRETQAPTFLGNGIAIPHGTTQTRDQVLKTGFAVFQFPNGIDWGDNQTAYIVIGIAAQSNEHLELLRQLTHIISDEHTADAMAKADTPEALKQLLMGERQTQPVKLDDSMVTVSAQVDNINTLKIQNIINLQNAQAVSTDFITQVLTQTPSYLGQGIWLSDSPIGNIQNAIAITTVKKTFSFQGNPVNALITLSYANYQIETFLLKINNLLKNKELNLINNNGNVNNLINLLRSEDSHTESESSSTSVITQDFTVLNPHGLHTRPSTQLVTTIKQFESTITVSNLDGTATPVNGRSLMKIVSLGAKCGHRLRIHAEGTDAQEAIVTIGEAINSGLGEEIA
ncbi:MULTISPECIES: fused PTS fructose transporter subunit IIA/HPr protein [Providencia]|uniref:fused PTS fructose transporter subunit IIA/HPr protein n=1 Tax=Providencia TaxID=586 RepID=UPI000D6F9FF6|nr:MULTISPECIES: fused PTS fructose transporter subunit IIA/HPr protein [Providencia]AWS52615.1 bifunctional PTS fructose transporter subunit IIA/HPr protein [Providencia rettgeri]ELR5288795.1 fused PTS fructose transporter subunit IIA/HPr protein [Providencia rettgeri]MCK9997801.1 fused PTS fructose transporter subunit IIA/HPr protein [Providencia rettgeri]MCL0017769.1 fused PTS fructose transporter subunit IIA/HPr protein [Providencia rettgeri]QIF56979.1 HPr family phosphocarrier protein [Pr